MRKLCKILNSVTLTLMANGWHAFQAHDLTMPDQLRNVSNIEKIASTSMSSQHVASCGLSEQTVTYLSPLNILRDKQRCVVKY